MNTTKELQTLTKFIQSTYTEMDLKIDEVKKQLKKDYEDKLIFHKQKHEELLKEWFNDETKNSNVSKIEQAAIVGKEVAEKAIKVGIEKVVFDRNGYLYHGRVKSLAEAAREAGLIF